MSLLAKPILLITLVSILSGCGCYRMPEDDEFSLIPSTNNPTYTREKASATPGVGY